MKMQRYHARDMRQALARIRAEQGPDAVILSTQRTPTGVVVCAAVDFDFAEQAGATSAGAANYVIAAAIEPAAGTAFDPRDVPDDSVTLERAVPAAEVETALE